MRNTHDISDVPIPNVSIGLPLGVAPSPTLLQQHMDVSELRELVHKLSDNQASMMDYIQSLIEPHPDRNLDFSHYLWNEMRNLRGITFCQHFSERVKSWWTLKMK